MRTCVRKMKNEFFIKLLPYKLFFANIHKNNQKLRILDKKIIPSIIFEGDDNY